MFLKEDLQTNLLKNADFCKLLSLPSDIFQAESVALALQNSFSEKYNALTEVFSEMTESPNWNHTPAFTKVLSIPDLMRFIVGFAPKTFLTLASFVVDQRAPTKSYDEEESESDLLGDTSI